MRVPVPVASPTNPAGPVAAIALRGRSTALRLVIMGVFAVMLHRAGFAYAGAWWAAYGAAQLVLLHAAQTAPRAGPGYGYVACFLSFAVAGAPTLHLWTLGAFGVAAASMWLCGMLVQLTASSLGAGRLFWFSAAPLVAYLILLPIVHFGAIQAEASLTLAACGMLFAAYLAVAHKGQVRAIAAVEASRRQAEAASRAKSEFLSVMSHEIRTPMNAVLGAAALLQRTELSAAQAENVRMLKEGGEILMEILNDVLDLSKIEAGKLDLDPQTVDVHALVGRCASFWRPAAEDAGLSLTVHIAPDAPRYVILDATRAGQIIFNLVSNALKFTGRGGVTLNLGGETRADGCCDLSITVSDTGMGMSQETQGRLFQAFEQADTSISRRFDGTGLGLAIAQRLAAMMGGRITVRSEEGVGSAFSLHLPVRLGYAPAEPPPSMVEAQRDASPRPRRVLLAEDNPANQRIIELFLRPLDAEVVVVENGARAVDAAARERFDVILMDMQMPVMDGLEATRRIRAPAGPNASTPVLALTANVLAAHQEACVAAGMDGHIGKPIDPRALITAIQSASRSDGAADAVSA
jgi:signal transduction histidine kinase/CheY-like chemotaxis protein